MKKVNFDKLEHFEIPDEWMEKALNAEPEKKPFLLRPRVLAAAASIVLIAAAAILLLKPFQSFTPPVKATPSDATETAEKHISATQETVLESKAATVPPTAAPIEAAVRETEAAIIPTEAIEEPEPTEQEDDPSGHVVKDMWYIDTRSLIPDAFPVMNDTSLRLDESELYTGDLTVTVAPDSPFASCQVIQLDVSAVYEPTGQTIRGRAYLEPKQGENGERTITVNLFDQGAYTPSGLDYTFRFYGYDDNDKKIELQPITRYLSSNEPVDITI